MESNLVCEFVAETGASSMEAYSCLQAKGWDLKLAIQDYLLSKDTAMHNERPSPMSCDVTDSSCKKLARGISRATDNINLVNKARSELGLDFAENGVCSVNQYFIETPVFTFTLPDLSIFPGYHANITPQSPEKWIISKGNNLMEKLYLDDFREFLEKDLIEISSLVSLEQAGRLNWWADNGVCQRLWPLATTGDGNCLLHAASLGMWGFHDRLLTLRRALHDFLSCSAYKDALWRRWRWQLTRLNAEAGLIYTEEEWHKEWDSIVTMASSTPRNCSRRRSAVVDKPANKEVSENATYESLEEIHVLALAHVLKRPIVVIADTVLKDVNGDALAPIMFGGIYLPLEIPSHECHKSPLVLTFDAAHFSALVVMEKETFADKSPHPPAVIPLTDSHHKLLPVQFSVDPGEDFNWGRTDNLMLMTEKLSLGTKEIHFLLREYLDVVYIPLTPSPTSDDGEFELELDTPCDEEDIEKRFIEANEYDFEDNIPEISESSLFGSNKSKAAKQMKSVAKQFGSIGKSMSKKLKKNLGTITKITRSNSQKKDAIIQPRVASDDDTRTQDFILCARLHTEARHEYQEEMIKNYLTTARDRFEREKRLKQKFSEEDTNFDDERLQEQAKLEGPKNCITQGCNMYGTVLTSYLCTGCYNKQRQEELSTKINSPSLPRAIVIPKRSGNTNHSCSKVDTPGYGTGRSTFYFEASPKSYESAKSFSMNSGKSLKPPDETIYLSNSTFYNDRPAQTGYYPKDWKSSTIGTGRNTNLQYNFRSEYQERPKTWQEEITNQIEGLSSVTLPERFSPRSDNLGGTVDFIIKKSDGNELCEEEMKSRLKMENMPQLRYRGPGESTFSDVCPVSVSETTSPSSSRAVPEMQSSKPTTNTFVTTIPVRQSSQISLDELVKETTQYYNDNKVDVPGEELPLKIVQILQWDGMKNGLVDPTPAKKLQGEYVDRKLCLNVTCKFFGSPELDNYCSKCHKGRFENFKSDDPNSKK